MPSAPARRAELEKCREVLAAAQAGEKLVGSAAVKLTKAYDGRLG